jgi:hypothetical protein
MKNKNSEEEKIWIIAIDRSNFFALLAFMFQNIWGSAPNPGRERSSLHPLMGVKGACPLAGFEAEPQGLT